MERHSPIFTDPAAFPAKWRSPEASLSRVYPESVDLDRAAFFFDYELEGTLPNSAYDALSEAVGAWIARWEQAELRPSLVWWHTPGLLQIEDRRDADAPGTYTFEDPLASLYLACAERPVKADAVASALQLEHPVDEVRHALDEFVERGLMMRDGNLFLSLAIPATGGLQPPA